MPRLRLAPNREFRLKARWALRFAIFAVLPMAVSTASVEAQQPWPQQAPYGAPQAYPAPQQAYPQPGYADPNAGQVADYGADVDQASGPVSDPNSNPVQPQAPLNVQQLEQLVAPIALYPDTLVAQILAAATYPAQVVDADHWRQAQGYASPDQVVYGANAQSWDPSLKALTAFPQVLAEMDQNIRWTVALGNAYYNQPQDVLDVVQVMRQRAQAAGNLASGPQEQVNYDQGYIQVAPANPDVVYLPAYDPWTAYGQPIQPYQGFSLLGALGSFFNSGFGSGLVRFGAGIATSAFSHSPFGLLSWGLNWLTHSLLFHNSNYYSHSTTVADWGLPHGGPRYFGPRGGYEHGFDHGYDRGATTARGPAGGAGYSGGGYHPQRGFARPEIANGYRSGTPIRAGGQALRPGFNGYAGRTNPAPMTTHPAMEAYNRQPNAFAGQQVARPMGNSYVRSASPYSNTPNGFFRGAGNGYGRAGFGGGFTGGYPSRPMQGFGGSQQAYAGGYHNPPMSGARGDFGGRGFDGGKAEKSSGSRSFGGGREEKAPKAPKMPKAPKAEKMSGGHGGGGHGGGGHHR